MNTFTKNIPYLLAGILFGTLLTKSEVISWWRIQEMYRLQSFHMYGVIGSAVVVGALGVRLLKMSGGKTRTGEPIVFQEKKFDKGIVIGGLLFGIGWGITGACPGPLCAQIGASMTVVTLTLLWAVAGTWVYGKFRERLPH